MPWFDERNAPKLKSTKKGNVETPTGVWLKCPSCGEIQPSQKVEENGQVCPFCQHHFRLSLEARIELITDADSFVPLHVELSSSDPLKFTDKRPYGERLKDTKTKSGKIESTVVGLARIEGLEVSMALMDFQFMGGSMGVVAGEKVALAADMALEKKIPLIVVSCSGGARMQEGILSLMQMAKTAGCLARLKSAGVPFISVLTDPTTGGVAASYAMLGDVIMAEPKALIGFAGPRVIEQSIRQTLPEGFQRSEFLLQKGLIDRIVERKELKKELAFFVKALNPHKRS